MNSEPATFESICAEASENFLQTVVVIDNQPSVGWDSSQEPKTATRRRSVAPGSSRASRPGEADHEGREVGKGSETPNGRDAHVLELNVVANAFAKRRLTCGVYLPTQGNPEDDEELISTARDAILPTDACVLDWQLRDNDPSQATEVIRRVRDEDEKAGGKLRLIIVYTAEPDLDGAAEQLSEAIGRVRREDSDAPTLVGDHLRIVFLNKPTTIGRHDKDSATVEWSQLPSRVVKEFMTLSKGLLRAHALQSVAAIRGDMHRIIAQFDPEYDAAFVADRASKPDPDDGGRLISEVLLSELALSIATSERAQSSLSAEGCKLWLTHVTDMGKVVDQDKKLKMLEEGVPAREKIDDGTRRYLIEKGTSELKGSSHGELIRRSFSPDQESQERSERGLAILATLAQHHGEIAPRGPATAPRLSLGTIVSDAAGGLHLCLQPRCDAVRVGKGRGFLFINLVADPDRHQFILPKKDQAIGFRMPNKTDRRIHTVAFSESTGVDYVEAECSDGTWTFTDDGNNQWSWVADLREAYASQASQVLLGQELARPGLNQLEWLRQKAGKG